MALNIHADWQHPLALREDRTGTLIYKCPDFEEVPNEPGVYVFGRQFGDNAVPLYIGRTTNLQKRLDQHLNALRLMRAIEHAPKGKRFFLYCTINLRGGQKLARVLKTLEDGVIAHALAEGHELLQMQGTRRPAHTVEFTGNRTSECIAPRSMMIRATS